MAKYGTMKKIKADYFWLSIRTLRKQSERVENRWEYYQAQRLKNATEILFIGKEKL